MWIPIKLNDKALKNIKEKKKSLYAASHSWMWFQTSWNLNLDRRFLSGSIKASRMNLRAKLVSNVVMETLYNRDSNPLLPFHEAPELLSHCLPPLYPLRQVRKVSLRPPRQFRKVSWYLYLKGRIYNVKKALNSIYYINTDSKENFLGHSQ